MRHLDDKTSVLDELPRRTFLGAGTAALASVAFASLKAGAQTRENTSKAEKDHSASNPGPQNTPLINENPNSNLPPPTDHGDIGPMWYSFDLTHRRIQEGGWTDQVTQRELPTSTDIAGVNMRLTAGSFRELHWHTANEWAYMEYGNARVTLFDLDGTMYVDDVGVGDLWYFPAGRPHSIQGLGPDGCQFLLVFDQGLFSEDNTFLISEFMAHTPADVLMKNSRLSQSDIAKLPQEALYIFPAPLPKSLAEDRASIPPSRAKSRKQFTFKPSTLDPIVKNDAGEVRVVDSRNFPVDTTISAGIIRLTPGSMRELHWHPNAAEWQYWLSGKGRVGIVTTHGNARTMDFHANDVGFVPIDAGHYFENTGNTDAVVLEMFKAPTFQDVSLNNWIRSMPPEMAMAHLRLDAAAIAKIPAEKLYIVR
jgi:oxalate decarboxylase